MPNHYIKENFVDAGGEHRCRVRSAHNGQVVFVSHEGFSSPEACEANMEVSLKALREVQGTPLDALFGHKLPEFMGALRDELNDAPTHAPKVGDLLLAVMKAAVAGLQGELSDDSAMAASLGAAMVENRLEELGFTTPKDDEG